MKIDLKGKRLLVLGCTRDDCQIVEAAKSMGVYTIVTDNHTDWSLAPAKFIADEAWDISWSDIDALKIKCIEKKIDGVMAGYSEFRTNNAFKLSRALGTKFYIEDEEQLKITRDKKLFKDICREYNVPVADDYDINLDNYEESLEKVIFPVIVKPTDNAGSRGIRSCSAPVELCSCIDYALSFSESKQFIVEELIKGHEVVIYYTIADGEVVCSSTFDKFARIEGDGFNSLPDVYFYPSMSTQYFMKHHNNDVVRMLKGMGLKNGVISLQSFLRENGTMAVFELGYRLGGTSSFHYTNYFNQVSHMDMLISYSLTGDMHKEELTKEDPTFKGNYACTFTLLSQNGIIAKQTGEEQVKRLSNVIHTCFYHSVGTEIIVNGSQFPKTFRAYIVDDSIEKIKSAIRTIQNTIKVERMDGSSMLYPPFNVDALNIYL
jgi:carbamoylphosphate synthase large subunit